MYPITTILYNTCVLYRHYRVYTIQCLLCLPVLQKLLKLNQDVQDVAEESAMGMSEASKTIELRED